MDLWDLWKLIQADLIRARKTLPSSADSEQCIRDYQDYLDNNELDLACESLEGYAEDNPVTHDFWLALRDAATKMELSDHARRYEARAATR